MAKHHADFVTLVLPEVLKDPSAYYITQQNATRISKTLTALLSTTITKPILPRKITRKLKVKLLKKSQVTKIKPRTVIGRAK
jgi:hypothetical protein